MILVLGKNIISLQKLLVQNGKQALLTFWVIGLFTLPTYAQKRLDSLHKVLKSKITDQEKVNTYNALAEIYCRKEDSSQVTKFAQQAIQLAERIQDYNGQADAHYWLGNLYLKKRYPKVANKSFEQSLMISQKNKYWKGEGRAYYNMGEHYYARGMYPEAVKTLLKALDVYKANKEERLMSRTYNKIGGTLTRQGAYSEAVQYVLEGLKVAEKIGDYRSLARSYNSLGILYYYQQNYSKTLEYYKKAKKIHQKAKRTSAIITVSINIGYVYFKLNDYDRALEAFNNALKMGQATKSQWKVTSTHFAIGEVLVAQKKYEEAIERFKKTLADQANNDDSRTRIAIYFGEIYFKQKKYQQALKYLQEGLTIAERIENLSQQQKGYQILAKTHDAMGNYRLAYQNYQLFKQASDSLSNEESAKRITRLEGEYQFAKERDSLQYIQQKKQVAFDVEIEKRRANQKATYIGLGLVSVLLIISILFFLDKQKSNRKLSESNTKLEQSYEEIKTNNEEIRAANDQVMAMNDSLTDALGIVQHQKDDILSSIEYAERIQKAMLPRDTRLQNAFPEHFIFFRPRDIVSGDFYWFAELEPRPIYASQTGFHSTGNVLEGFTNQKYILAAIDCTGHGVPGAFMSMIANNLLNYIVSKKHISDADLILNQLHLEIKQALHQTETKNEDGMEMSLVVVEPEKKLMQFAGAKNPLWYIQKGEFIQIKGDRLPIGGERWSKERVFTRHGIDLNEPVTFYMFSDGYQDQFGGEEEKRFTKKRLRAVLENNAHLPIKQQEQILGDTLNNWMEGHNEQIDDILVMGVKIQ